MMYSAKGRFSGTTKYKKFILTLKKNNPYVF